MRALLGERDFRRLLAGQTISAVGDWVAMVALIALVWRRTESGPAVGGLIAARFLPALVAGPVAGALADRYDRKRTMVACDLARAGVAAAVPFAGLGGVYALAFLMEAFSVMFGPPRDASIPDIVPRDRLALANGMVVGSAYATLPIGAALYAGIAAASPSAGALASHPQALPMLVDAATFLVSAVFLAQLGWGRLARTEAARAAAVHPERATAIVLADAIGCLPGPANLRAWMFPYLAARYLRTGLRGARPLLKTLARPFGAANLAAGALWARGADLSWALALLRRAGIPSHVLWGTKDVLVPAACGRRLAELLGATFELVDGDHEWPLLRPAPLAGVATTGRAERNGGKVSPRRRRSPAGRRPTRTRTS